MNTNNTKEYNESYETFDSMSLRDDLLRGIYSMGFEHPSAIQQRAIKPVILGHDIIAQAQSGTGKTATFSIGCLQNLNINNTNCQTIILSPTRELAQQTQKVVEKMGEYMKVKVYTCVGGTSVRDDIKNLGKGVHIVVGTPGRVYDMITRKVLNMDDVKLFILDEADEMLNKGFKEQIYSLFKHIPSTCQVALFSATMPNDVLDVTDRFMKDPVFILVKKDELTLEGIKQFFVQTDKEDFKFDTLCDLFSYLTVNQSIIYCNKCSMVEWLANKMIQNKFTVSYIHGEMDQSQRDLIMKDFRNGSSRVLITTDLLARGIDIQQVSLVVNYNLPISRENYIHRIGRSGRFGRKGIAINLITNNDIRYIRDIETFYRTQIEEMPNNIESFLS